MKKNEKIVAVLLMSMLTSLSYAQIQMPSNNNPVGSVITPSEVGKGNTYEKEVTPLLRDISKKKSLLELRKLDRELEKIEEEALTSQIERDKMLNPLPPVNVTQGSPNLGQALPNGNPSLNGGLSGATPAIPTEDPIRVLMVYGFDNNLYAKVANGTQGGYIVKKGDVLPDGRVVTDVNSNFVEVRKSVKSSASSKTQKLYISGPLPPKTAGATTTPAVTVPPGPGNMFIPSQGPQILPSPAQAAGATAAKK